MAFVIGPVGEDSLENTFSCVPKVQGIMPNLSGKRTGIYLPVFMCFVSSPLWTAYFNFYRKGCMIYAGKTDEYD